MEIARDEIQLSVRLMGDSLDPGAATDLLGVPPSHSHAKGAPVARGSDRRHPTGLWSKDSTAGHEATVDDHLQDVLSWLEPRKEAIARLIAQGLKGDVYCSYFSAARLGALAISPDLLFRVGTLGLALTINIYCPEDSQNSSPENRSTGSRRRPRGS